MRLFKALWVAAIVAALYVTAVIWVVQTDQLDINDRAFIAVLFFVCTGLAFAISYDLYNKPPQA